MAGFKEYNEYDGLGLADLVRRKEISADELFKDALNGIERLNPRIRAVVTPMYDLARKAVRKPPMAKPKTSPSGFYQIRVTLKGDDRGVTCVRCSRVLTYEILPPSAHFGNPRMLR